MKKYLTILILFFSFTASSQIIYTPMSAGGYQMKYLKTDSGFALPFRDTTIGRGVNRPGLLVVNTQDSILYIFNGKKWTPAYVDSTGVIGLIKNKVDSVTLSGNNLFYWSNGTGYGSQLNKLDSIYMSNDSVYTCIAGNCTFRYISSGIDSLAHRTWVQASDSSYLGVKGLKNVVDTLVVLAPDGAIAGGGGTYTASNGLTLNGSDIQLGGTISKSTTINTSTYPLVLNGNGGASSNVLKVTTTDGYPLWSTSVNNLALYAKSTNGQAAEFDIKPTSTNTVASAMTIFRGSQGTAANGLGTSLDYELQDVDGFIQISNQLITKWSDAAPTTRTSEFSITGVNNAITGNILRIAGNGNAQFYGTVQLKGYTVATLPTGVQGMTAYVTDASSPAFLATVVGGGSTVVKVFYNGTNWIVQ